MLCKMFGMKIIYQMVHWGSCKSEIKVDSSCGTVDFSEVIISQTFTYMTCYRIKDMTSKQTQNARTWLVLDFVNYVM